MEHKTKSRKREQKKVSRKSRHRKKSKTKRTSLFGDELDQLVSNEIEMLQYLVRQKYEKALKSRQYFEADGPSLIF